MFPGRDVGLGLMTAVDAAYPIYGSGPSALADQWRAGMIMWAAGAGVLGAAIVVLGWRGLVAEERRQRVRDAHEASVSIEVGPR